MDYSSKDLNLLIYNSFNLSVRYNIASFEYSFWYHDHLGAITSGAAITIGSGGTLAIVGVASVQGAAIGAAAAAAGGAVMFAASKNFSKDYDMMKRLGNNKAISKMTAKQATAAAKRLGFKKKLCNKVR